MSTAGDVTLSSFDLRKLRTRGAIVTAAQAFLAAGTTSVSVKEITDAAGVGLGSFYNHFDTKDELFAEAVAVTLDLWSVLRDEAVAGLDDHAEIFAVSFRMTGRLQRVQPELVRIILNTGMSVLSSDRGLRPRALADIGAGIEKGRFTIPDAESGLMAAGGLLLGLLQLLESDPTLDVAATSDLFAARALMAFGLGAEDAEAVATGPLPELPDLTAL